MRAHEEWIVVFVCRYVHVLLHVNLSLYTRLACFTFTLPWNISKRGNTVLGSEDEKDRRKGRSNHRLQDGRSRSAEIELLTSATKHERRLTWKNKTLRLAVTPMPSSTGWGAVRLLNLHNSKGQSMEEGPFVRNCQRRQGPQAWSPRVKSAYLGCHLDTTGPQGQGRGVKLLTTLNVTPALLYYERHAKWLTSSTVTKVTWYITLPYSTPPKTSDFIYLLQVYISSTSAFKLVSFSWNMFSNYLTDFMLFRSCHTIKGACMYWTHIWQLCRLNQTCVSVRQLTKCWCLLTVCLPVLCLFPFQILK